MRKIICRMLGILIFIVCITSCASIGSKTTYRADNFNSMSINKLGYSQPVGEENLNKIIVNTSNLYYGAIAEYYASTNIKIEKHKLSNFTSIENIEKSEIAKICNDSNLDGFLCIQISYVFADNYYLTIPLGKSEDTFVEAKLFDKNGNLLVHTKHNTAQGNSYFKPPSADKTVPDGIFGALKQLTKELSK